MTDIDSIPPDIWVTKSEYQVPDLAIASGWATAHSITGKDVIGSDGAKSSDGADLPEPTSIFSVTPGTIKEAEDTILKEVGTQIDNFESFKKKVWARGGWVFITDNPNDPMPHDMMGNAIPGQARDLVDGQNQLLRTVADSIELVGQFVARLNNAAQFYAEADIQSFGDAGVPDIDKVHHFWNQTAPSGKDVLPQINIL